ncbi:hypothetical protein COBT_003116, partial [Conglomerata obtusa]
HQGNGRIERAIGTIRNTILKIKNKSFKNRVDLAITAYNHTFHSAIGCSLIEAITKPFETKVYEKNPKFKKNKKVKNKLRYPYNEKVRIAQHEQLKKTGKVDLLEL